MNGKLDRKAMEKALKDCVDNLGKDILRDGERFRGAIYDLLPDLDHEQERRLLLFAVIDLKLGKRFLEAAPGNEARQNVYNFVYQDMLANGVYTQDAVEAILGSFAYSLGWRVKSPIITVESPIITLPSSTSTSTQTISSQQSQPSDYPSISSVYNISSVYKDKQVGDRFYFGRYPQSKTGSVKQPIEWRVLRRDSDSLLVISDHGLDCKRYDEKMKEITWADCTLRRWLNDEFINEAFSEEERSKIKTGTLTNIAGPNTKDRVFLLSEDETKSYFASNIDRRCKPTKYAVKNGVFPYNDHASWWLQSRGDYGDDAKIVNTDGDIYNYCVDDNFVSVRPALYLAI